jgi:hypothetical protein
MLWIVRHFTDNPDEAERFTEVVSEVQGAWETLAPDPRLAPYKQRYSELLEVWLAWRRGTRTDRRRGSEQLRRKTQQLVQENISFERLHTELPAHTIDADFLAALEDDDELTPEEKATDIEAALTHEAKPRGQDDPRSKLIIERLNRLRKKREHDAQMTLDGLKEWEDLRRRPVSIWRPGLGRTRWSTAPPNGTIGRALTRESLTSLEPVGVARSLHGSRASRRAQVLRIVTSLIRELGRGGAEPSARLATVGFRAGGSSGQIPDTKFGTEEVRFRRFQQPGSFYWGGDKPCVLRVHCAPFGVGPGTASGGHWRASL